VESKHPPPFATSPSPPLAASQGWSLEDPVPAAPPRRAGPSRCSPPPISQPSPFGQQPRIGSRSPAPEAAYFQRRGPQRRTRSTAYPIREAPRSAASTITTSHDHRRHLSARPQHRLKQIGRTSQFGNNLKHSRCKHTINRVPGPPPKPSQKISPVRPEPARFALEMPASRSPKRHPLFNSKQPRISPVTATRKKHQPPHLVPPTLSATEASVYYDLPVPHNVVGPTGTASSRPSGVFVWA